MLERPLPRYAGWAAFGFVTWLCPQASADAAAVCLHGQVVVEGRLAAPWVEAVEEVCRVLGSGGEVDPSVNVRVVAAGQDVIVEARLADGRSTLRRVNAPGALQATVEALAIVPPAPDTPSPVPMNAVATGPMPPFKDRAGTPAAPERVGRPASLELGANVNARLAGSLTLFAPGVSAYGGLRVAGWLLAVTVRWDPAQFPLQPQPSRLEMDAAGAGFALARGLELDKAASIEGGATAAMLVQSESFEASDGERSGTQTDIRLGLLGRLLLGHGARRVAVSVDGDVSPARLRRRLRIDAALPPLPSWEAGLGLGVAWGEP